MPTTRKITMVNLLKVKTNLKAMITDQVKPSTSKKHFTGS